MEEPVSEDKMKPVAFMASSSFDSPLSYLSFFTAALHGRDVAPVVTKLCSQ
jgi:hypothetical protein